MTDGLPEFLLARFAEEKKAALGQIELREDRYPGETFEDNGQTFWVDRGAWLHADPVRLLAECDAKRRIVEAYQEARTRRDTYQSADARADENDEQATQRRAAAARTRGLEIALEALALPYTNHKDFQQEWLP